MPSTSFLLDGRWQLSLADQAALMVLQRGPNGDLVFVSRAEHAARAESTPPDLRTRLDSRELRRLAENAEQKVRRTLPQSSPFHPRDADPSFP